MIAVYVVHPSRLFREGLCQFLLGKSDLRVCGSAAAAEELLGERPPVKLDCVLLDLGLPGRPGLDAARSLKNELPGTRILMTGVPELADEILACIEAGASGYVLLDASLADLLAQLRAVASGRAICSPRINGVLLERLAQMSQQRLRVQLLDLPHLTRREREVVAFLVRGRCNKEIAGELGIELQTVKNHVHNVLEKLSLKNRSDVARKAREWGLVESLREDDGAGRSMARQ